MVHEMLLTEDKAIPWIAASKSSDQKLKFFFLHDDFTRFFFTFFKLFRFFFGFSDFLTTSSAEINGFYSQKNVIVKRVFINFLIFSTKHITTSICFTFFYTLIFSQAVWAPRWLFTNSRILYGRSSKGLLNISKKLKIVQRFIVFSLLLTYRRKQFYTETNVGSQ